MILASGAILGLPISVVLFGAYLLWRYFSSEESESASPAQKLKTNTWTWTWQEKKVGFKTAVRVVLESKLYYTFETGNDSAELYRVGRDDSRWTPAYDEYAEFVQWALGARKLHLNYLRDPQKTVIEV